MPWNYNREQIENLKTEIVSCLEAGNFEKANQNLGYLYEASIEDYDTFAALVKAAENPPRSLVLLKPDCLERKIVGSVLMILFEEGFQIEEIKTVVMTTELCRTHYAEHLEKPWYPNLEKEMCGKKLIAIFLNGDTMEIRKACAMIRSVFVDTAYVGPRNVVHSSDSVEAATRELNIWFNKETQ